jgi:DNA invertase Pin-like site-specific DNA recombinase
MNNCYVYRHIRHDKNEVFYIGYAEKAESYYDYEAEYSRAFATSRNMYWHNIVALTDYTIEIVFDNLTSEDAYAKEIELITLYGRSCDGGTLCNILPGGKPGKKKGVKLTEETKKKIADAMRGKTREEISAIKRQKDLAKLAGRKCTEENKRHLQQTSLRAMSYPVSCDGVVYEDTYNAAKSLFPETKIENAARGIGLSCKTGRPYKGCVFTKAAEQLTQINYVRGQLQGCSKLTEVEVVEIKTFYNKGIRVSELVDKYSASYDAILHVILGITWTHINPQIIPRTEKWGNKFKESDIPKIKELFAQGSSPDDIAEIFEVHKMAVLRVLNGKTWDGAGKSRDSVPRPSLKEDQVIQIKHLMADGVGSSDIAKRFNVDICTIQRIKKGDTWSDVAPQLNFKTRKGNCKLTAEQVEDIKSLLDAGVMVMTIAKKFGVHRDTIGRIRMGKAWKEAA